MKKIAFDTGPLTGGHSVRGIGMMAKEQIEYIKKEIAKHPSLSFHPVDFSRENLDKYDLVHYPYFFPFQKTLPSQKPAKKVVVTVQDLIHLIYPKSYPSGIRGKMNFIYQKRRINNVDAIITISETSKKDIVRFLKVNPEKIYVSYLASKKTFGKITDKNRLNAVKNKYHLPTKFALYVGDVNYNKNLISLVRATKLAKIRLVIAGKQASEINESSYEIMSLHGPRDWVRYLFGKAHPEIVHYKKLIKYFDDKYVTRTGYVSDEDLAVIYNLASVYVQPSYYEGFGLPVVEAMRSGCPVIVSKTNSLIEITDGAALTVDPYDKKDIADKMNKVINDMHLRRKLILAGHKREKFFNWEKTAKEIIEVYKNVLNE